MGVTASRSERGTPPPPPRILSFPSAREGEALWPEGVEASRVVPVDVQPGAGGPGARREESGNTPRGFRVGRPDSTGGGTQGAAVPGVCHVWSQRVLHVCVTWTRQRRRGRGSLASGSHGGSGSRRPGGHGSGHAACRGPEGAAGTWDQSRPGLGGGPSLALPPRLPLGEEGRGCGRTGSCQGAPPGHRARPSGPISAARRGTTGLEKRKEERGVPFSAEGSVSFSGSEIHAFGPKGSGSGFTSQNPGCVSGRRARQEGPPRRSPGAPPRGSARAAGVAQAHACHFSPGSSGLFLSPEAPHTLLFLLLSCPPSSFFS